ncbi:hypothetical protein L1887_18894 [Cichorium endivia]|nr:hypothetical protein L1887_18894 [Cichorium endivia]
MAKIVDAQVELLMESHIDSSQYLIIDGVDELRCSLDGDGGIDGPTMVLGVACTPEIFPRNHRQSLNPSQRRPEKATINVGKSYRSLTIKKTECSRFRL